MFATNNERCVEVKAVETEFYIHSNPKYKNITGVFTRLDVINLFMIRSLKKQCEFLVPLKEIPTNWDYILTYELKKHDLQRIRF